ncbi:MAG: DUF2149 domain-containing protein [Burkholderiaceae bacterium]
MTRRLHILAEEDDDPMLSAVNLVDVFLVVVVALLTAVAVREQSQARSDETVIRHAGTPQMEIIVRKNGQEITYRGNGGSTEGQGERAGVAYRLKDGSILYVPETGETGEAGASAAAR